MMPKHKLKLKLIFAHESFFKPLPSQMHPAPVSNQQIETITKQQLSLHYMLLNSNEKPSDSLLTPTFNDMAKQRGTLNVYTKRSADLTRNKAI